jgi:uncharacterized protein HemX
MSIISDVIQKLTIQSMLKLLVGAFAVIVLLIGVIAYQHKSVKLVKAESAALRQNISTLTQNVAVLQFNYLECQSANSENSETIDNLLKERTESQAAIMSLASQKESDLKKIASLQSTVDQLRKDPKNNGALAPVLRETIRQIQENDTP